MKSASLLSISILLLFAAKTISGGCNLFVQFSASVPVIERCCIRAYSHVCVCVCVLKRRIPSLSLYTHDYTDISFRTHHQDICTAYRRHSLANAVCLKTCKALWQACTCRSMMRCHTYFTVSRTKALLTKKLVLEFLHGVCFPAHCKRSPALWVQASIMASIWHYDIRT